MRAALIAALALVGCSGKEPQGNSGGLVVVVESDLSMPEDIDRIRIEVTQLGKSLLVEDHAVGAGQLLIPTEFHVGSPGNSMPVTVRGVAFKAGQARIERSAVTPVPTGHLGKLRLPMNYLCDGTANADGTSTCGPNLTCQLGTCRTSTVAPADVPVYQGAADAGATTISTVGGCFDVLACFAGATDAVVEEITCTIPLPDQAMAGRLNVALSLPVGSKGICNTRGCWVVLDSGADGWTVDGGRIRLPEAVCKPRPDGSKLHVVLTTACMAKNDEAPTCGAWSSVNTPIETPPPPMFGDDACGGSNHQTCGRCGTQTRTCQNGKWSDWSTCTGEGECAAADSKACTDGGTQTCGNDCHWGACLGGACAGPTTQACGHCGTQSRTCTNGAWSDWSTCSAEGVCAPGATQSCGQGGTSTCDGSCQWGACACTGPATQTCGDCGTQSRSCANGKWSDCSTCSGQGVCAAGATQTCGAGGTMTCSATCTWGGCENQMCPGSGSQACGRCGTQTRTCNQATLTWSAWGACGSEGPCQPGATQACGHGGTQTCSDGCQWGACKGQMCDTGPTMQACGNCGTQTRTCDGDTGTWSAWSTCTGEKTCQASSTRTCGNQGTQTCGADCEWKPECLNQQCVGQATAPCPRCGQQTRVCDPTTGQWGAWAACSGEGDCNFGETRPCSNSSMQTCNNLCHWDPMCWEQMCKKGADCVSALCDDALGLCVQMCTGGKLPTGGLCRSPNGEACTVGKDCASGFCSGFSQTCVQGCHDDEVSDATGVCVCPAGYTHDGGGLCKLVVGATCSADTECATGFCDNTNHCATTLCGTPGACTPGTSVSCGPNQTQACSPQCQLGPCLCATGYGMCGASCVSLSSDANNCGSCGHVCGFGQTCSGFVCSCPGGVCPTVLGNGNSPWGLAVVNGTLYWSNAGGSPTIASVPTSGGATSTVVTGAAGGRDMDVAGGYAFWSDGLNLYRYNLGIGGTTMMASYEINSGDTGSPYGLDKVKSDGTNVYYLTNYNVLRSIPVGGGAKGTVQSGPFNSNIIDVVLTGNTLYWTNDGIWNTGFGSKMPGTAKVMKSVGGAFGVNVVTGGDYPLRQIAADANYVFWVGPGGYLFRTDTSGGNETFYTNAGGSSFVDMISDGTFVYAAQSNAILRMPVTGNGFTTFVTGATNIRQLAIDGTNVYWTDGSGYVAKMPK